MIIFLFLNYFSFLSFEKSETPFYCLIKMVFENKKI